MANLVDMIGETIQEKKPEVGDYWTVKNGKTHFLYSIITSTNPLTVKYFEPTVQGKFHCLNDDIYPAFDQDLDKKISPPTIVSKGKFRKFYTFK